MSTNEKEKDTLSGHEMAPLLAAPPQGSPDPSSDDKTSDSDVSGREDEYNSGFIHSAVEPSNRHYSKYIAVIFIINYSVGSGILGLPAQYFEAGYILGTLMLAFCCILTYAAYKYVGNLIFRAEAVTSSAVSFGLQKNDFLDDPEVILSQLRDNINIDDFKKQYTKFYRNEFELNHLIGLFCGRRWRICYDITFFLTQMIALWSYCALFGVSLARVTGIPGISHSCNMESSGNDSDCRLLYTFYVCIFWIWCIVLVLMDFTEQMGLQIASFIARLSIMLLMIISSIGLIYGNLRYDGKNNGKYTERSNDNIPFYGHGSDAWKWNGLLYFIAVASFAFSNQFCVPDVIEPLRHEDRKELTSIVSITLTSLFIIYAIVGITVSLYFGEEVEDPCTLAWKNFRGFMWNGGDRPGWSYFFSYAILLLPPVDLASSYPLNMITLSNTIEQSLLDLERLREDANYFTKWKVIVRVSLVSITAILALLVWDFGFIIVLSGICGLIALYLIPAYAEYKSQLMCKIITNDDNAYITPVTDWSSNKFIIYAMVFTAMAGVIGVIVELSTD